MEKRSGGIVAMVNAGVTAFMALVSAVAALADRLPQWTLVAAVLASVVTVFLVPAYLAISWDRRQWRPPGTSQKPEGRDTGPGPSP